MRSHVEKGNVLDWTLSIRCVLKELLNPIKSLMYRRFMVLENNRKPTQYMKLHKALHGYIMIELLIYDKISRKFQTMGFLINQ